MFSWWRLAPRVPRYIPAISAEAQMIWDTGFMPSETRFTSWEARRVLIFPLQPVLIKPQSQEEGADLSRNSSTHTVLLSQRNLSTFQLSDVLPLQCRLRKETESTG